MPAADNILHICCCLRVSILNTTYIRYGNQNVNSCAHIQFNSRIKRTNLSTGSESYRIEREACRGGVGVSHAPPHLALGQPEGQDQITVLLGSALSAR